MKDEDSNCQGQVVYLPSNYINYDVILDHAHIHLLSESLQNPEQFPASAGASTFATAKSNNSSD